MHEGLCKEGYVVGYFGDAGDLGLWLLCCEGFLFLRDRLVSNFLEYFILKMGLCLRLYFYCLLHDLRRLNCSDFFQLLNIYLRTVENAANL